jgi:hypothetical protein
VLNPLKTEIRGGTCVNAQTKANISTAYDIYPAREHAAAVYGVQRLRRPCGRHALQNYVVGVKLGGGRLDLLHRNRVTN